MGEEGGKGGGDPRRQDPRSFLQLVGQLVTHATPCTALHRPAPCQLARGAC